MTDPVAGIVLCGGGSTRMGTCKAWLECGGETLLQRVVRIVAEVADPIIVAARPGQALPPLDGPATVVHDAFPDAGPLAGLEAGLRAAATHRSVAFVCPCDHPRLQPAVIRLLVERLADAYAVVPSDKKGLYPLLAVYRTELHAMVAEMLASGRRRASDFTELCGARKVDIRDIAAVDPELYSLQNINSPDDLADMARL